MKGAKQQCVWPTVTRTVLGKGTRVALSAPSSLGRVAWQGCVVTGGDPDWVVGSLESWSLTLCPCHPRPCHPASGGLGVLACLDGP